MKIKIKIISKVLVFLGLTMFFSGCTSGRTQSGGFLKSVDGGKSFAQEATEDQVGLTGRNVLVIEVNPANENEIFIGTRNNGLYKSVDQGKTWLADVNNFKNVYDIEKMPGSDIIYMAAKKDGRGKVLKSSNGGEAWEEIYTEKDEISYVTSVAIHKNNHQSIYISSSNGGLFKSEDGGQTWRNLYWANSLIRKIEIDNINPNIIYLATTKDGLLLSEDSGKEFKEIIENGYIYNVVAHPNREGCLYASSKKGLMKSLNRGADWENLNTLVKPDELVSRGLAINPRNPDEIYYVSGKAFYKSTNQGETWITTQMQSGDSVEVIEINYSDPSIIYLGTNNRNNGRGITPSFKK